MKVPISWLKQYVPVTLPPRELAHRLTMAGAEVGDVEEIGGHWARDKVLVGRVLKVEPHPNADRLTLPTVEVGNGETASVVCGAPNVAAGQKIAFAREGAELYSQRSGKVEPLKSATIRGVESAGMVCSALELGLGEDHEGILVLADSAPVGTPLVDYMGDAILDIEVTPNRPDLLSILGVAHEVAALTNESVSEPDVSYPEEGPPIDRQVKIEIADPDLCARYTASLITGMQIAPSPRWMQEALERAGQRPINNVVDITNYVMLEYGQPLHAFDFNQVKNRTIIVRAARPGEVLVTLDGERRALKPPMLTIADATDAVGLAGVMGGANSEMHEGTKSVLLESANFDPVNTRRTSSALRLSTEASYRFERGIRAELAPRALRRATQLIVEIAGGTAAQGIMDLFPGQEQRPAVKIGRKRVRQLLGVDYEIAEIERVVTSLGFEPDAAPQEQADADDTLWVKAPYWRSDVTMEDDLVEEVARIVGYDTVPTTMLSAPIPHREEQPARALREQVRDGLAAAGMREVITYSLTDLATLGKVEALEDGPQPLRLSNSMSRDLEFLRSTLRANVLDTLASGFRSSHGEGLRIYELGRVYLPRQRDLPEERQMAVGVMSGPRSPSSWQTTETNMDFFDAKGVVDSVLGRLTTGVAYEPSTDRILQPGRTARIVCEGAPVGVIGEVRPHVLARFDLADAAVALFEIDLDSLGEAVPGSRRGYQAANRFPESYRDLALVVDADVPSSRIQAIIAQNGLVTGSTPFDLYSGPEVPSGKKSIAYRVVFQSSSGTLTAEQVNKAQQQVLRQLEREVGAKLRQ